MIFLGSLMIAMAILYAATKDRWRWRKIIKRTALMPITFALCIGILIWIYSWIQDMPTKQSEFDGVKLGDYKEEVLFKKGNPDGDLNSSFRTIVSYIEKEGGVDKMTLFIEEKGSESLVLLGKAKLSFSKNSQTNKLYSESEIKDLLKELVEKKDNRLYYKYSSIFMKDNKVKAIKKRCDSDYDKYFYINDIGCGYSLSRIENKLGVAKKIKCSQDFLTRVYYFPQYQSAYEVDKEGVKTITVYDKSYESELYKNGFKDCQHTE